MQDPIDRAPSLEKSPGVEITHRLLLTTPRRRRLFIVREIDGSFCHTLSPNETMSASGDDSQYPSVKPLVDKWHGIGDRPGRKALEEDNAIGLKEGLPK